MREKQSRPRAMGLNIGSASIIMLFAVLCLTVLAALSLLSANSQYALSERSAAVTRAYYAAEVEAAQTYELVKNGDMSYVEPYEYNGEILYSYTVDIDQYQSIVVLLAIDGGETELRSWKIVEAGSWVPDDFFDLWTGDTESDFSGGFFLS